jgi:4-diphosphocytidyl-2-C-methyl-D-erythritol kinase
MDEPFSERAPAKLNLFLRVLGRRDDGYHDIESLIVPLSLADQVTVRPREGDGTVEVVTPGAEGSGLPSGPDNLAAAAALALREELGRTDLGAVIELTKSIPVAGGLGGGSADAAAVLRILGRAWSVPSAVLRRAAAEVGSDVPALLAGGPVLVGARGEAVRPIELPRSDWVVLPQPLGVAAEDAYRWWDEDGEHPGPDPGLMVEAARAADADAMSSILFNDLEGPVARRHPEILEATRTLLEAGALTSIMCGSGPTVAGLCRDRAHAKEVASATGGIPVSAVARPQE